MSQPKPSAKQLAFIAQLEEQTGVKVKTPTTIGGAKNQIKSLLKLRSAATPAQISKIKFLAAATDLSFEWPSTKQEAHDLIDKLQRALTEFAPAADDPSPALSTIEAEHHRYSGDYFQDAQINASGFQDDETIGYGSDARWAWQ